MMSLLTVETYYVLLGAVVGACIGFFGNYILIKRAERNELKKTKSVLKLEFRRIYKMLLNNIGICEAIKHKYIEMRKEGKIGGSSEFIIFDIFQNLLIDTIILHSLISTGSILRLSSNEIGGIQVIENELAIYNNGAKWFLVRPKKFENNELVDTLDKIIFKINETLDGLGPSLNFEWFDKDKMITEVTDELKYEKMTKNDVSDV